MNKLLLIAAAIVGTTFSPITPSNVSNQKALDRLPTLNLPAAAANSSVFSLGTAIDPITNKSVQGYAIIKRKDKNVKPDWVGNAKPPKDTSCYEYLAKDAKWKVNEPWMFNPTNADGLDENILFSTFNASVNKWESAANFNILGNGSSTFDPLAADMVSPDGNNEVYFASIDDPGVIGVTIVWGIFGGRPAGRELMEWDQVYDNADYQWSLSGEAEKMDFENIATHELGHTVGLADLYTTECNQETMYGYAGLAETYKQDLFDGDVAGIFSLYQ